MKKFLLAGRDRLFAGISTADAHRQDKTIDTTKARQVTLDAAIHW